MSRFSRSVGPGIVFAATALIAACSGKPVDESRGDPGRSSAPEEAAEVVVPTGTTSKADGSVIVHVRGRHHLITARSAATGPVYTVRDKEGNVLADALSSAELAARRPDLFEEIRTLLADAETRLWAGRDHEARETRSEGEDRLGR